MGKVLTTAKEIETTTEIKTEPVKKTKEVNVSPIPTIDSINAKTSPFKLQNWVKDPIKYEEKWTATLKSAQCIGSESCLFRFNLNPDDFADMKEGEIREVFINLED